MQAEGAIDVVAAVISDPHDGRVLVARRPHDDARAHEWEFPGGKLLSGESLAEALIRELREELGVEAGAGMELDCVECRSDRGRGLRVHFIEAQLRVGAPRAIEHAELRWVELGQLDMLELSPADREFVRRRWG